MKNTLALLALFLSTLCATAQNGVITIGSVVYSNTPNGFVQVSGPLTLIPTAPQAVMLVLTNPANTNGVSIYIGTNSGSLAFRASDSNQNTVSFESGTNATNIAKFVHVTPTATNDVGWMDVWGNFTTASNLYIGGGGGGGGTISIGKTGITNGAGQTAPFGSTAYPAWTNLYWVLRENAIATGAEASVAIGTANQTYCTVETISGYVYLTNMEWYLNGTAASSHMGFSIYAVTNGSGSSPYAGTKLYDTGPISTASGGSAFITTAITNSLGTGGILPPGQYVFVVNGTSTSLSYAGINPVSTLGITGNKGSVASCGTGANSAVAGQNPNTLGAISAAATAFPYWKIGQ